VKTAVKNALKDENVTLRKKNVFPLLNDYRNVMKLFFKPLSLLLLNILSGRPKWSCIHLNSTAENQIQFLGQFTLRSA